METTIPARGKDTSLIACDFEYRRRVCLNPKNSPRCTVLVHSHELLPTYLSRRQWPPLRKGWFGGPVTRSETT